jgi:hypothetical protein
MRRRMPQSTFFASPSPGKISQHRNALRVAKRTGANVRIGVNEPIRGRGISIGKRWHTHTQHRSEVGGRQRSRQRLPFVVCGCVRSLRDDPSVLRPQSIMASSLRLMLRPSLFSKQPLTTPILARQFSTGIIPLPLTPSPLQPPPPPPISLPLS